MLIHFNADTFDIPYIQRLARQYRLPWDLSGVLSIDLYKKIRPYRELLGLPNCKLKTVEQYFGISREDRYSGGELIYVYEEYLRLSEQSFSRVWYGSERVGDTGSYDETDGGMFWRWYPISNPEPNRPGDGKMACINFPAAVAALTLAGCVPEGRTEPTGERPVTHTRERYFEMGREIYEWGVENLFDAATGRVADSRHGDGEPDWKSHVYNQGTFIGASVLLYRATGEGRYLTNALLAADYVMRDMSKDGILPFESGIEQGIYTAIYAQYMAMLVYDCGQRQYLPFLRHNISAGWANRDAARDICGGEYARRVERGQTVDSYSASGIPALMLLFATDRR